MSDELRTQSTDSKNSGRFSSVTEMFEEVFGGPPTFIASAPGRVNLIGEHTDYNDGYVFPVAIDKYINIAARERTDQRVVMHALDVDESLVGRLEDWKIGAPSFLPSSLPLKWSRYLIGVASLLQASGRQIAGIDAVITGDVPIGAGLSSSAALSVAATLAFLTAGSEAEVPISEDDKTELAALCQRVEHEFAGVKCGIMDQTISLLGQENCGLFLDCRSLEYEQVPLNLEDHAIAICNTKVKRELATSEYNKRRAECERGVDILRRYLPGITSLRDITLADLKKYEEELPALTQKRCRYVIEENARVVASVSALKCRDEVNLKKSAEIRRNTQAKPRKQNPQTDESLIAFGNFMNASHHGLRDDYQVSCPELDLLTDIARDITGVVGSRMTGAGFGGCTVSIVRNDALETFQTRVTTEYQKATGIEPEIYLCSVSGGAQVFWRE